MQCSMLILDLLDIWSSTPADGWGKDARLVWRSRFFLLWRLEYTSAQYCQFPEFKLYKWLQANAFDRLLLTESSNEDVTPAENVWKERKDAEIALRNYLSDLPSLFLHVLRIWFHQTNYLHPYSYRKLYSWSARQWQNTNAPSRLERGRAVTYLSMELSHLSNRLFVYIGKHW